MPFFAITNYFLHYPLTLIISILQCILNVPTFVRFWLYFSVIFQFFMFYYYLFNHLSFLLLFTVCTSFVFGAKFINLVQICLKNSHYNFFGAACIYRYFYVPVQFATFLSGCILVTFWFLVSFFAIIIWFWLPFQYTIITGLFDNLHYFKIWCIFEKLVQFFHVFPQTFNFGCYL